ncbi:MAG: phosphatidylglycerophosphatase A [Pseudomonadota bacterium]
MTLDTPLAPADVQPPPQRRADWRFLCSHPAHWLALGAGSGLSPVAPGTVGTLWAWLAFVVFDLWLTERQWGWVLAAALPVGWWACTVTARNLGTSDPGQVVWDEVIAFWLVLWVLMPAGFGMQLAAFVLFRWLDATKPGPVGWADRLIQPRGGRIGWREGWGILIDDLVAAGCTLLLLAVFVQARSVW